MRNLRRLYWFISGYFKKYLRSIFTTALVTIITFVAIPTLIDRLPSGKPHLRVGLIGQYTPTDLPLSVRRLISAGLTEISEDGTATPALALSWEVKDQGKSYLFNLDPRRHWHDGAPFQAADINYSFPDITMDTLGAYTVEFKLKEPFAPFPTVVTQPLFRQTKALSRFFKKQPAQLVGIGAYSVAHAVKQGSFLKTLKLVSPADKITYKFYNSQSAAVLGFKLGEVDRLEELAEIPDIAAWKTAVLAENIHFDRFVAVLFNTQDPTLADKNIRRALSYAITAKETGAKRSIGPLNPRSWSYNPQVKSYDTNIDKAKDLLKTATKGKENLLKIRLDTNLAYLSEAEKIKRSWDAVGVDTQIRVINSLPEDYQALLAVHHIPADPDQYAFWHSTQTSNLTKLKSPKIDKLLEDARKTIDQEVRREIYYDFQRSLLEEAPAAFLFYQTTYTLSRN